MGPDASPGRFKRAPHVVIIGAGFAGLSCAKALGASAVQVTVVDRRNYHLFVPLLYQVATAALSPADIAVPIRRILGRFANLDVVMGEVTGIDTSARTVRLKDGHDLSYDELVVATGSSYNYFAHPEWSKAAPGPKSIGDAREIRASLLSAYERAEITADPMTRKSLMTTVVVGGGPTGVEMAGSIAELSRFSLKRNFKRINPADASIVLIEAGPRLLSGFPDSLANYAKAALERLGVTIRLNTHVEQLERGRVLAGGEWIGASTIVWGAGIRAAAGSEWLGSDSDKLGRIRVNPNLSVPDLDGVYVIGDLAHVEQDGRPLPALAQVAAQEGRWLGRELARHLPTGAPVGAFRFHPRGDTAVIGRNAAVFTVGGWNLKGGLAWFLWAIVHIYLLIGFDKRVLVATQWLWRYFTYQRGVRLID